MSEHIKNSRGKIYSDFAYRLGVIAQQYDLLKIEDKDTHGRTLKDKNKYETTLYICILQNLLTPFKEVKDWATKKNNYY